MDMNKSSIALVAMLCVAAAGGGAYLAGRNSPSNAGEQSLEASGPDGAAVEESEAIVAEPEPAAPRAVAAPSAPAPSRVGRAARPSPPARSDRQQRSTASEPVTSAPAPERVQARAEPPALAPITPPEPIPVDPPEPAEPRFEELVVSADSVIGLQLDADVNSERARVEDRVVARVTRDVRVGDRVAIPSGSRAEGEVTLVERGGKVRDRARLGIRFTSIVLADGTRVPIETETLYREGDAPGNESAAKIGGGAVGGAIIGGILGGAKGAIIGGSAGAGAGTAAVLAGGRNPAAFPAGTPVTVRITQPATVTIDK